MSKVPSKFIRWGITSGDVSSRDVPANFTPSNYTPSQVAAEGTDKVSAHLKGIDTALGTVASVSGDIALTSFTIANNQSSPANVTGLSFGAGVRSARVQYSIFIDASSDTFESGEILIIQKTGSWDIAYSSSFDSSFVIFTITSGGQVQYTSPSYSGYTSGTMKFRAWVTTV